MPPLGHASLYLSTSVSLNNTRHEDPPVSDSDMRKMHAAMAAGREGGNIGVAEFSAYVRQGLPPLPAGDQVRMARSAEECAAAVAS